MSRVKDEGLDPLQVGACVALLTPSYHWTGRIVACNALRITIADAIIYTELGQVLSIIAGTPKGAHGDPVGVANVPGPTAQVIALERLPEVKQYNG